MAKIDDSPLNKDEAYYIFARIRDVTRDVGEAPKSFWITPENMVKLAGSIDYIVMIANIPVRTIEVLDPAPDGIKFNFNDERSFEFWAAQFRNKRR